MPRLPDDGEAVLGTRAIPHVCRVPAAGQELCWAHRRPRPGWWALWLEAWPSEGGGGWAAAGFGLGAATWMGGWEAGKDFRRPGTRLHTGARQQCLREGWGSVRAVTTGEGRPGGDGGDPPAPRAAGRVSVFPSWEETCRPYLSLFTGFFKFGVTVSPRGPPPRWTSG